MKPMTAMALSACALLAACSGSSGGGPLTVERVRTRPTLRAFSSTAHLRAAMVQVVRDRARAYLEGIPSNASTSGGGNFIPPAFSAPGSASPGQGYSGTNNQEPGVEEADLVKTDGQSIFVLNGDRLEILDVSRPGTVAHLATAQLEGEPRQLLLSGDFAVVFSAVAVSSLPSGHPLTGVAPRAVGSPGQTYRWPVWTEVTVVDVADPASPAVTKQLYLECEYRTARGVGNAVRLICTTSLEPGGIVYERPLPAGFASMSPEEQGAASAQAMNEVVARNAAILRNATVSDFVPSFYEKASTGDLIRHDFTAQNCTNFAAADDAASTGITSILTLNLGPGGPLLDADHVVCNPAIVYASEDTMLITEDAQEPWWLAGAPGLDPAANIHRFDISAPHATIYTGSGRVDGLVNDSFSLSEYQGFVRVATTTGGFSLWASLQAENHVWVLGGTTSLDVLGHVGGIGNGDRIWSCRFVEEKAYLVTFHQLDPLWTVDLSDPRNPAVVGELEVEGVSTYIHPLVTDGRLLTVGFDGGFRPSISLFDVRSFANPLLDDHLTLAVPSQGLGWRNIWSEATYDHKAFTYWEPHRLLAVPVDSYRQNSTTNAYEYVSELELILVDATGGSLTSYGVIDHSPYFNSEPYTLRVHDSIRRSIFIGDFIYAISDRAVTVHDVATLTLQGVVELPGS